MSERKYQYKKPKKADEHIEALYEELSLSSFDVSGKTLKDYVRELVTEMRRLEWRRTTDKKGASYRVSCALGGLAILAIISLALSFGKPSGWAWLDDSRFMIQLWGIAFSIIFVGVSIERSSFFNSLWKFGFTKLVASIAISALVVFSTGKASLLINEVFPVDASALPFTRAIVAGLLAFQYSYSLLVVVGVFAFLHMLMIVGWIRWQFSEKTNYEDMPILSMATLFLSLVILLIFTKWVNKDFSTEMWPAKIYRLAHALDFNSRYECRNLPKGVSVIFLGPDQSRVLVDINNIKTSDLESFVNKHKSNQVSVSQRYFILPCE